MSHFGRNMFASIRNGSTERPAGIFRAGCVDSVDGQSSRVSTRPFACNDCDKISHQIIALVLLLISVPRPFLRPPLKVVRKSNGPALLGRAASAVVAYDLAHALGEARAYLCPDRIARLARLTRVGAFNPARSGTGFCAFIVVIENVT